MNVISHCQNKKLKSVNVICHCQNVKYNCVNVICHCTNVKGLCNGGTCPCLSTKDRCLTIQNHCLPVSYKFSLVGATRPVEYSRQRLRLCAVGELTNCLPTTEAKFITKSRSLELLPSRITSAETKAWICTADDCFNVMPQLHKTFCWLLGCYSQRSMKLFLTVLYSPNE